MSREIKIGQNEAEEIVEIFNLDDEVKHRIFEQFNKFKVQTSIRRFIKVSSKELGIPENILGNFFKFSYSLFVMYLESRKNFDRFFEDLIQIPMVENNSEIKKSVDNFNELKAFVFKIMNMVDFEYYEIQKIEDVIQINVGYSMIVSLYIFHINGKTILIDAGHSMQYWKNAFFKALKEINVRLEDIDYCFITHEHPDHTGLVEDLKQANPNIKLCIHEFAFELAKLRRDLNEEESPEEKVERSKIRLHKLGLNKEDIDMLSPWVGIGMNYDFFIPDVILKDGDKIVDGKLRILHTPGHSAGCICILKEANKILFTGDHVLSETTPHIGTLPIPGAGKFNEENNLTHVLDNYLKSLEQIEALNSKIILGGHDETIYDPYKRIVEIKNHHQNRLFEISNIILNKPKTPYQISMDHWEDLEGMSKVMAISECLVHLDYLEDRDFVSKEENDGIIYYISKKPWKKIEFV